MNCTDPRLYALLPAMHNTTQNPTNPAYKKTSKRFWKKKVPKCLPPFNNIFYGGWWWSSFLVIVMLYKRSSLSFFRSLSVFFSVSVLLAWQLERVSLVVAQGKERHLWEKRFWYVELKLRVVSFVALCILHSHTITISSLAALQSSKQH